MPTTEHDGVITYRPDNLGYQPRPEPETFRAPKPYAPAPALEGSAAQRAHKAVVLAHAEYAKHVNDTNAAAEHYTAEGLRHQIDRFHETSAARAVQTEVQAVHDRRDAAAKNVEAVKKSLSPNGDTAAELRASRFTARMLRQLDAADGAQLMPRAQEILKAASREELGVALVELPAYLTSRGSTAEWVDPFLGQLVPEYGQANAQLRKAEAVVQITDMNVRHLQQAYAGAQTRTPLFASPDGYDPDGSGE